MTLQWVVLQTCVQLKSLVHHSPEVLIWMLFHCRNNRKTKNMFLLLNLNCFKTSYMNSNVFRKLTSEMDIDLFIYFFVTPTCGEFSWSQNTRMKNAEKKKSTLSSTNSQLSGFTHQSAVRSCKTISWSIWAPWSLALHSSVTGVEWRFEEGHDHHRHTHTNTQTQTRTHCGHDRNKPQAPMQWVSEQTFSPTLRCFMSKLTKSVVPWPCIARLSHSFPKMRI